LYGVFNLFIKDIIELIHGMRKTQRNGVFRFWL